MKQRLLLITLCFACSQIFAQDPRIVATEKTSQALTKYLDSMRKAVQEDARNKHFYSHSAYDNFFDKYFTLLNYERSNFTEGNSAALETSKEETRLNLTLSHKSGSSIFSVGSKLNISDKSGVIFSGSKPSSGTEIFVSHSFLLRKQRLLVFDGEAKDKIYRDRYYVLDSIEMLYQQKNVNLIHLLLQKQDTLIRQQRELQAKLTTVSADSIYFIREALSGVIDKITKNKEALKEFDNQLDPDIQKDIMKATTKASVEKELQNKGVTAFRMRWISYGITYRRDHFNTWDGSKSVSSRIGEQDFNKWGATAAYNFVWQRTSSYMEAMPWRKINSLYLGAVYSLLRGNNFTDITEQEYFTRMQSMAGDTLFELTSTKKLKDITNKKFDTYFDHQLALQSTILFGKTGFWGLNLRQEFVVGDHSPYYNSRIGTLFRFIDSKDEKSKVNFEVFLKLDDLADHKDSGKTPWQRKEIGISTTLPFSKVFFQ